MFKLLVNFLCFVALTSVVLAQNVYIVQPQPGTDVPAGSNITVQLDKPRSLTGSTDIAVVIGAFPCQSADSCPDVTEVLGDILYSGPYASMDYSDFYYPYENFTVNIPSFYNGPVQLGVAHFFLLGAGQSATLQFANTTLNVVPPQSN